MDQGLNWELARALNSWAGKFPIVDGIASVVADYLIFLFFLAAAVWWFVPSTDNVGKRAAMAAFIAVVFGQLVNLLLGHFIYVPRPFVAHQEVQLLVNAAHDSSFPSDHTTAAFSVAITAILWGMPGRWLLLIGAVLIAIARVFVGAHYPLDVLAGAALGTLWAYLVFRLDARLRPLYDAVIAFARRIHLA